MNPDEVERIGRVIDVFNLFKTIERMLNVVQCNLNYKIDLLLPIGLLCKGESPQELEEENSRKSPT